MIDSTYYLGTCLSCKRPLEIILIVAKGVIPPPIILVSCACEIPVTEVKVVYQGNRKIKLEQPLGTSKEYKRV